MEPFCVSVLIDAKYKRIREGGPSTGVRNSVELNIES